MENNASVQQLAMKEARRAYLREWRRKNPDKVRAQRQRYWEKKGREFLESLAQQPANP